MRKGKVDCDKRHHLHGLAILEEFEIFLSEPANRVSALAGHDDVHFDQVDSGFECSLWRGLFHQEEQQHCGGELRHAATVARSAGRRHALAREAVTCASRSGRERAAERMLIVRDLPAALSDALSPRYRLERELGAGGGLDTLPFLTDRVLASGRHD